MVVYLYTPDQVMYRGCMLASKDWTMDRLRKLDRDALIAEFKSYYGSHPVVLAQLWEDLQTTTIAAARIDTSKKRSVNLKTFLRAHQFIKQYPTERQRRIQFANSRMTIRTWTKYFIKRTKYFIKRIQALKEIKIKWPDDNEWTTIFLISVDGVHCIYHEEEHPTLSQDPNLFSWKSNGPGLSYELALHLYEPRLCWVKQNAITKHNDRQNFIEPGGLRERIPNGKKVIADRGYRGAGGDAKVAQPNSFDSDALREFKARGCLRQECFHARIKLFKALDGKFRHSREYHQTIFEAVCVLCVYEMELVNPLFDV